MKHLELYFAEEITASNNYLNMAEKLEDKNQNMLNIYMKWR